MKLTWHCLFISSGTMAVSLINNSDTINVLPSNIIQTMLTLLPMRDAFRTSILSRDWKEHCATIPKLRFDDEVFEGSAYKNLSVKCKLTHVICPILLLHRGPILDFSLCFSELSSCSQIDQIILYLSKSSTVKKFMLCIGVGDDHKLLPSFFMLQHLTCLTLQNCAFQPPSTFCGFSRLTSLHFFNVSITCKVLLHFVANCPLLKQFTLFGDAKHLTGRWNSRFVELFECLPLIEYLHMSACPVRCFATGDMPQKLPTLVDSLTVLHLTELCFVREVELRSALLLVTSSPNIREIVMEMYHDPNEAASQNAMNLLDLQDYSNVNLDHLRELKITNMSNTKPGLDFVKLILAKSPMLKKLRIVVDKQVDMSNEVKMLRDLVQYQRASTKAEIRNGEEGCAAPIPPVTPPWCTGGMSGTGVGEWYGNDPGLLAKHLQPLTYRVTKAMFGKLADKISIVVVKMDDVKHIKHYHSDMVHILPSNIIHTILDLLPMRDAFRTSILSRNWRHHSASIPQLQFDDEMFEGSAYDKLSIKHKLTHVVYPILLLRRGPILKFSLCLSELSSCSLIDQIILYLSKSSTVKKFTLWIEVGDDHKLLPSFFMLQQLTCLNLQNCVFQPPSTFCGFSRLTCLYFHYVSITCEVLLRFLVNCPLLKEFTLTGDEKRLIGRWDSSFVELFECLPLIEYLHMSSYPVQCFAAGDMPQKLPTLLNHLRVLNLAELCFALEVELRSILLLVTSSPNIQEIVMEMYHDPNEAVSQNAMNLLDLQDYSNVNLDHLRELEIRNMSNTKPGLDFVKLILAKAPMLKKVGITVDKQVDMSDEVQMLRDLVQYRRASNKAEIERKEEKWRGNKVNFPSKTFLPNVGGKGRKGKDMIKNKLKKLERFINLHIYPQLTFSYKINKGISHLSFPFSPTQEHENLFFSISFPFFPSNLKNTNKLIFFFSFPFLSFLPPSFPFFSFLTKLENTA
ncbi:hypothetical protein OSB04_008788 [Centaurea solstitialis]|uniref:F-box domain-containing protein n=1 Tax=Centaurea solstitialis TaxID=347529 RepID=A0AA38TUZ8_9ASTR|nr:hypothetical protein OSB04_008788 [Centaurea solstitialis]